MKKILISLVCCLVGLSTFAQNSIDALRFSRLDYSGSARFNAMGGSFGALGGEISGLNINPAGAGIYRSSEFTFSTALSADFTETSYLGRISSDDKYNFNIPNIGYVSNFKGNSNGWKSYSFALSYNRSNSFNTRTNLNGETSNSITNDYAKQLNDNNATIAEVENYDYPFGASQAWYNYMLDYDNNSQKFVSTPYNYYANTNQNRQIETRGNQSETAFTLGGNYQDRLYLGGSIGFQRIRFEQEYTFNERYSYNPPAQPTDTALATRYTESTSLLSLGAGVNFKFGAIYRINDALRIGGAIHSPTFYGINEEYSFNSDAKFANGDTYQADGVTSSYRYQIRTPAKYIASIAYLFLQKAAINFDYEYIDYSTAKFDDSRNYEYDYSESNQEIKQNLKGTHNFRVGGELNLQPLVFRAGYRYEGNPFESNLEFNPDQTRQTLSFGGGFKSKNYNVDIGYSFSKMEIIDPVYNTSPSAALITDKRNTVYATVGWRW